MPGIDWEEWLQALGMDKALQQFQSFFWVDIGLILFLGKQRVLTLDSSLQANLEGSAIAHENSH